jgi:tetraprenyl-beta-curcumene synthase
MPKDALTYLRILVDFLKLGADYWLTVYPKVVRELRHWRTRASTIPDCVLRGQALCSLEDKRRHAEGAAAFAVISPRAARRRVVRFLVAFQVMYDYLDTISENAGADDPLLDTMQLHTALTEALMPGLAEGTAYAFHPRREDGGYLHELIAACQTSGASLPAFPTVAPLVQSAARLAVQSQGYNHVLPTAPPGFLAEVVAPWAAREGGEAHGLTWWEVVGATGSSLAILVLVAAAADPGLERREGDAIHDVYVPWAGAVLALVDSLIDQAGDATEQTHSLVGRYESAEKAAERVGAFVARALALTRETSHPERHALIVASMVALFASAPAARAPEVRDAIKSALNAAGPLGVLPLMLLRARRRLSGLRRPFDDGV